MTYDVFLSHASADKPAVEAVARRLCADGYDVFLHEWHLIPGEPWQEALEEALEASRTCAVFLGKEFGPWQNEEMRHALDERVSNKGFRVIPVLLPEAREPDKKDLPRFLQRFTWVEFHNSQDDAEAYYRLVCGIRGERPGAVSPQTAEGSGRRLPAGTARVLLLMFVALIFTVATYRYKFAPNDFHDRNSILIRPNAELLFILDIQAKAGKHLTLEVLHGHDPIVVRERYAGEAILVGNDRIPTERKRRLQETWKDELRNHGRESLFAILENITIEPQRTSLNHGDQLVVKVLQSDGRLYNCKRVNVAPHQEFPQEVVLDVPETSHSDCM